MASAAASPERAQRSSEPLARAAAQRLPIEHSLLLTATLCLLAGGEDSDLRISALQAVNDALRDALTDLHAFVEGQSGDAAAAINAAIWTELSASTQRRAFASASF